MKRAIAAVIVALLCWSYSDVLIWRRIFERNHVEHDPNFVLLYQQGHALVLAGLIVIGALTLWSAWSVWYAIALYTLAYSGLADILYYWLDGRALPATMPWLDQYHPFILFHPVTSQSIVASVLLWIVFWSCSLVVFAIIRKHPSYA